MGVDEIPITPIPIEGEGKASVFNRTRRIEERWVSLIVAQVSPLTCTKSTADYYTAENQNEYRKSHVHILP